MLCWAQSKFSLGFAASEILAKRYQHYIPLSAVSPYQWKIWLDFCLHKVRFPKLNHDILPGYRGQGGITDRPRFTAIEPMQTEITDTFLFSCKRFIPLSNERVHCLLLYLNFFHRVCLTTLCFSIDCHENEPRVMWIQICSVIGYLLVLIRRSKHFKGGKTLDWVLDYELQD